MQGGKGACIRIQFQELGPRAPHAEEHVPHTKDDLAKKVSDRRKKAVAQALTALPPKIPAHRQEPNLDAKRSRAQPLGESRDGLEKPKSHVQAGQGQLPADLATPSKLQPGMALVASANIGPVPTAPPRHGGGEDAQACCSSDGAGAAQAHAYRHRKGGEGAQSWYGRNDIPGGRVNAFRCCMFSGSRDLWGTEIRYFVVECMHTCGGILYIMCLASPCKAHAQCKAHVHNCAAQSLLASHGLELVSQVLGHELWCSIIL